MAAHHLGWCSDLSEADVVALLVAEVEKAGGRQAWADKHGVTYSYVWQVMAGVAKPGAPVLKALGLRKETRYVRG